MFDQVPWDLTQSQPVSKDLKLCLKIYFFTLNLPIIYLQKREEGRIDLAVGLRQWETTSNVLKIDIDSEKKWSKA